MSKLPPDAPEAAPAEERLPATLGPFAAAAIVVGGVIGTGIFLKPYEVTRTVGDSVSLILFLWIACGVVNLCGALALAELAAMLPHAGGTYVFLREAYGRAWAFLWAWAEFWVIRSGAIAALAVAMAAFIYELLNQWHLAPDAAGRSRFEVAVALLTIVFLSTINIVGTHWAGFTQNVTTVIKAGFVALLAVLPLLAIGQEPVSINWRASTSAGSGTFVAIGAALAAIMWAYDGWGMVTVVAEEIREPQRNVPRALAGGVIVLILLYAAANLGYYLTLPTSEIAADENRITALAAVVKLLGPSAGVLVLLMLIISCFGALNSNILVGPRVVFAVARDHHLYEPLKRIDPRFATPALSIGLLSLWACALVLGGDLSPVEDMSLFDLLTNYVVFGGSIFYLTAVMAVYVLRWRWPDAERPYRTWGYPFIPAVFGAFYLFFLWQMYWARPYECQMGLLFIAAGAVWYAASNRLWPRP